MAGVKEEIPKGANWQEDMAEQLAGSGGCPLFTQSEPPSPSPEDVEGDAVLPADATGKPRLPIFLPFPKKRRRVTKCSKRRGEVFTSEVEPGPSFFFRALPPLPRRVRNGEGRKCTNGKRKEGTARKGKQGTRRGGKERNCQRSGLFTVSPYPHSPPAPCALSYV
jgi:hypothetical protein